MWSNSFVVNTNVRSSSVSPCNKKPDSARATQLRTGRLLKPQFSIPLGLSIIGACISGAAASGGPVGFALSDRKMQAVPRMEKVFANPAASQMTAEQARLIGEAIGGDDSRFVINNDGSSAPWLEAVLGDVTNDNRIYKRGDPPPAASLSGRPGEEFDQKVPSEGSYQRVKRQEPSCSDFGEFYEWGRAAKFIGKSFTEIPIACSNSKTLEFRNTDLTNCNFENLHQFHRLKYFRAYDSNIPRLTNNMIAGTRVERIDVINSQLTIIENLAFNGTTTPEFKFFLAQQNNLEQPLPPDVFQPIPTIRMILMNANYIRSIPTGLFANLTRLDSLSLNDNMLNQLPERAFESLTRLSTLNLSNNQLTSLDGLGFGNMTRLQSINVAGNRLSSIPGELFELSEINKMDLRGNRLTGLPPSFFRSADAGAKLTKLYLESNRWNCCEIYSVLLENTPCIQMPHIKIIATDNPECSSPRELEGMKLANVRSFWSECGGPRVKIVFPTTEAPESTTEEPESTTEEPVEDKCPGRSGPVLLAVGITCASTLLMVGSAGQCLRKKGILQINRSGNREEGSNIAAVIAHTGQIETPLAEMNIATGGATAGSIPWDKTEASWVDLPEKEKALEVSFPLLEKPRHLEDSEHTYEDIP